MEKKRVKRRTEHRQKNVIGKSKEYLKPFEDDGIAKVFLSEITQKFIQCRIGEDISTENPWVLVKKEKICDNLDLHEQSSEFLPIKSEILNYPEPDLLVGSYSHSQDKTEAFFVCITTNAKKKVIDILYKEKCAIYTKLLNSLNILPNQWNSLGSEEEVNADQELYFRPLFAVEIEAAYPLYKHKRKISCRFAGNTKNEYIYCNSTYTENIFRKRVDKSVQITRLKMDQIIQTDKTSVKVNKTTQYNYEYIKVNLSENAIKIMLQRILPTLEQIHDILNFDMHINLFYDDFLELPNQFKYISSNSPKNIINFKHSLYCKGMEVSSISCNYLISGIFAASYVKKNLFTMNRKNPPNSEDSFNNSIVIVWCFTDHIQPKLILHSDREVTFLSFCPYNEDILVGGCSNGQVVIWDLKNRIEEVEKRIVLTHNEHLYHNYILSFMDWMKYPLDKKHVYPAVVSRIETSHRSSVTGIQWMPLDYFVTKNGHIRKNESIEHMQFCTSSLNDGTILIWELKCGKPFHLDEANKKVKSKRPSELAAGVSPFKKLHQIFEPYIMLRISNPTSKFFVSVLDLVMDNQEYLFEVKNPETLNNYKERTFFEVLGLKEPFMGILKSVLPTINGNLIEVKWVGNDFDQGQSINSVDCIVIFYKNVHDAPIKCCLRNPFDPNILLTIGGKIFALWDVATKEIENILWRKGTKRYTSGLWSSQHPLSFILIREDSMLEFWSPLENSKWPILIEKFLGCPVTGTYTYVATKHVRKDTILATDEVGNIAVFSTKVNYFTLNKDRTCNLRSSLREILAPKIISQFWKDHWKLQKQTMKLQHSDKNLVELDYNFLAVQCSVSNVIVEEEVKPLITSKFDDKLITKKLQEMYMIMLKKNKINLAQIMREKVVLKKTLEEYQIKNKKLQKKIQTKDNILSTIKERVTPKPPRKAAEKINTISFTAEERRLLKQNFFQKYIDTEIQSRNFIESNSYKFEFCWSSMIKRAKCNLKEIVKSKKYDLFI